VERTLSEPLTRLHPGQVWWCDGVALGFEAHFKRRPVLVLQIRCGEDDPVGGSGDTLLVAPLSSKRRFGQEQTVTHAGGVSYLTGQAAEVSADALLSPLGTWDGFAAWRAEQQEAAEAAARTANWLVRFRRWLRGD